MGDRQNEVQFEDKTKMALESFIMAGTLGLHAYRHRAAAGEGAGTIFTESYHRAIG